MGALVSRTLEVERNSHFVHSIDLVEIPEHSEGEQSLMQSPTPVGSVLPSSTRRSPSDFPSASISSFALPHIEASLPQIGQPACRSSALELPFRQRVASSSTVSGPSETQFGTGPSTPPCFHPPISSSLQGHQEDLSLMTDAQALRALHQHLSRAVTILAWLESRTSNRHSTQLEGRSEVRLALEYQHSSLTPC